MKRDGMVYGMPEAEYHGGPELSSTSMKRLLEAPARFKHERENPTPPTAAMELGTVIHARVLGTPDPSTVVDGGRGVTERRNAARDEGLIPLTPDEDQLARDVAKAVREHPDAALLLDAPGTSEVSGFTDLHGVRVRVRFDRLPDSLSAFVDLKSSVTADPRRLGRVAADGGWHLQAALYRDVLREITGHDAAPVHIVVEKTAPYLVSVIRLDDEALAVGRRAYEQAIDIYKRCAERDEWPGFGTGIHPLGLPRWADVPADLTEVTP